MKETSNLKSLIKQLPFLQDVVMVSEHTEIELIKENEEALPISASPEFTNWLEKEGREHQNLATCHQSFYPCENIPSHNLCEL